MTKRRLNLTVDPYLVELAEADGMNISEFLQNKLSEHYKSQIEDPHSLLNSPKLSDILK